VGELERSEKSLLRNLVLEGLTHLSCPMQGQVAKAIDTAVDRFNALSARHRATKKCGLCGERSVRGEYRQGRRMWVCDKCCGRESAGVQASGKNCTQSKKKRCEEGKRAVDPAKV